ncbi:MAG: polysaccharide biosynthesis tyrosine autokinase, partial [Ferruginibacter sp.]
MNTNNSNINRQESDENLFQQLVSKYLPYWPVFLVAGLLGIAVAYVYIRYAVPIYEADATLIIKDERKGNEDSKMMESLDQLSSKKIVENEIEVLQSRRLMTDVINKLGLYAPIYEKGNIKTLPAYTTSPISILLPYPDSIAEPITIKLDFNATNEMVVLNDSLKYPLNQIVTTPFGRIDFVTNKNYEKSKKPSKQFYFSLINPIDLAPSLLSNLKADASSKLSSVVNLSYTDAVPKRAKDILNQLINSYRQSEIDEKDALAKNTLVFVEDRLTMVAHDLDSIERKVQQYKSGRGAVDIGAQGQLYLQNVSANDQKLSDVNSQLSVLVQVEKFVKNKDNSSGFVPSTLGITDPTLSQLVDKLSTSELEYERLKRTVGENNPNLVAIRDQINKIKPNILQNIESQQQGLNATRENISATNNGYNSILEAVPQKERELLDISREQQFKSNIYSFLLQKREESQLAYASTVSNNKVVDYAEVPSTPISPKILFVYMFSVFGFVGLCIAVVGAREVLSGKVLYRNEIESRTSIPIIGEIAFDKSKTSLVIEAGKRSFVAEEFRKLRISLSFLGINSERKKILVTSSISGEGKSFIAANLAVSLSLTGKKVILVDLDLNNPTIGKILNVDDENGITQYLKGQKEPEQIIKRVKAHENLFFIPAGNLPENPTELLANEKIKEIIDYLDNIFDIVIIDTSPIVLVTDAY